MPRFARPRRGQLTALSITTGITAVAALMGSVLVPGLAAARNTAAHNAATAGAAQVTDPAALVNPFIGTTNNANDFPGADVPFGMVQWSPDTTSVPTAGATSTATRPITGFSLTHLGGAGLQGARPTCRCCRRSARCTPRPPWGSRTPASRPTRASTGWPWATGSTPSSPRPPGPGWAASASRRGHGQPDLQAGRQPEGRQPDQLQGGEQDRGPGRGHARATSAAPGTTTPCTSTCGSTRSSTAAGRSGAGSCGAGPGTCRSDATGPAAAHHTSSSAPEAAQPPHLPRAPARRTARRGGPRRCAARSAPT